MKRPLQAPKTIAFINEGGGTGKTTNAVLLGMTLAAHRGGPVIAVDASPGCGDLANRVPAPKSTTGTVRSVVAQAGQITSYEQVRAHTNKLSSGLEVLAADSSMSTEAVFTGSAYEVLAATLRRHYEVVITDCAAGMVSDVVDAVLADADLVVIVSEGGDGVRSSTWTANWMNEHSQTNPRYKQLLEDAVVVVNSRHDRTNTNTAKIIDFYRNIVRAVVELPFDQHLEGGNIIDVNKLSEKTREQLLVFADAVMSADGIVRGADT
ncbi:MinD/ParA family ATP-binding protein [Prescottella subtropica]|uniref:MinD/ParA family ATP-binding protein n=1 Tax=Prescottella subtropica TaxID=2545757 RepID=UPI001387334B|nr:MinD/ParA family protein [Prescottella subtropica]